MISVGKFAELAQVSARTVRYYESIGLLPSSSRGDNNYRHYDMALLTRMKRIRELQELGFSLEEIKQIIHFSESEIHNCLKVRLQELEQEINDLQERRHRINELLSVSNKIKTGETLTETERNLYMESIKAEIIKGLKNQYTVVTDSAMSYLNRDGWLQHHPEFGAFLDGIKKCVEFAKQKHFFYGLLSKNLENWLKPNFGTIIYHEDLIKIISENTGWNFAKSNALRRTLMKKNADTQKQQNPDWIEFEKLVPTEISNFVVQESKWSFCFPHAISFAKFTKQSAILKSLHKEIYYAQIQQFEQKHGVTWDDIGIRMQGVSLHQG